MAEMLNSQIVYSLRSEIRKKILWHKLRCSRPRMIFLKKFRVAAIKVSAENFECILHRLTSAWLDLLTHGGRLQVRLSISISPRHFSSGLRVFHRARDRRFERSD